MSRFTAHDSGLQAIMNYPNVRGLFGLPPVKPRRTEAGHQRSESFEFRAELQKWAQELSEPQSNDKPVDNSKGPKRARDASPEPEDESMIESPPKKQKTEVESDDAVILEQDDYSIWDAMLWGSSYPGITESLSPSSSQSTEQALPDIGDSILDAGPTIPKSWNFTIWEDEDAGTDDYSMVGRAAPWVPEHDNENKENEPPEFDVGMEEANDVSEFEEYHYPGWSRRLPRIILGELQHN